MPRNRRYRQYMTRGFGAIREEELGEEMRRIRERLMARVSPTERYSWSQRRRIIEDAKLQAAEREARAQNLAARIARTTLMSEDKDLQQANEEAQRLRSELAVYRDAMKSIEAIDDPQTAKTKEAEVRLFTKKIEDAAARIADLARKTEARRVAILTRRRESVRPATQLRPFEALDMEVRLRAAAAAYYNAANANLEIADKSDDCGVVARSWMSAQYNRGRGDVYRRPAGVVSGEAWPLGPIEEKVSARSRQMFDKVERVCKLDPKKSRYLAGQMAAQRELILRQTQAFRESESSIQQRPALPAEQARAKAASFIKKITR